MRELVQQQKKLDDLLQKIASLRVRRRSNPMDGDRIDYSFVRSIQFRQQDNSAQNILFSIPQETDFVAERLSFYPSYRFITTDEATNGPPEISFRPCLFTFYEGAMNPFIGTDAVDGLVDCFVDISESYVENGKTLSRRYQNMPTPMSMFYSGVINYRSGGEQFLAAIGDSKYDGFEFPSGMVFPCPYLLTAGSALTIRIAPSFAGARVDPALPGGDPTQQNEYQVTAVLEGFKKVWK